MALAVKPPLTPMLARSRTEIPTGPGWRYEPKWDGFRALVFRDGADIHLGSRGERPLHRYFPELLPVFKSDFPRTCVVDGEIVIPLGGELDFDALLQRIHPAASRVKMLSETTPATFVAFDLLAVGTQDLREKPLAQRWARLVKILGDGDGGDFATLLRPGPRAVLTPLTEDADEAARWLEELAEIGLDGIIAKQNDLRYQPGERVMVKVKRRKTADCVVGGYRLAKNGEGVGSLLLGLYEESGALIHVGFCSSFKAAERRELLKLLKPLEGGDAFGFGVGPGGQTRWRTEESAQWVPLEPRLVGEFAFDHVTGHRFRHGTTLLRWRPDKDPRQCTIDQMRPARSRAR
jgi:ATP-dependent DNA ligase